MKTISAKELDQIMERDEGWVVIDTLPQESYEKEHIPGAHHVHAKNPDFVNEVEKIASSKEDQVIVYCADKDCGLSPNAAEKLEKAGFKRVLDFEGGLDEWKQAGFEVTSKAGAGGRR